MTRPLKYGKSGHSFDSETTGSVYTTPPLSPRSSQVLNNQLVSYQGGVAHHGSASGSVPQRGPVVQPTYYVQSPSRDSFTLNEGDFLSQSFAAKSSPSTSPLASPLHKSFSSRPYQSQVQGGLAGYYSNNPRPGSRRVLPQPKDTLSSAAVGVAPILVPLPQKKGYQPWNGGHTIQEEEEQRSSSGRRGISRWCLVFLSSVIAILCLVVAGLTYWLVCRPSAPKVEVKNINFQTFSIDQGNDPSGVPTQVLNANITTTLSFGNPSKYFGFHVSAPDVTVFYQQIVVAEGEGNKFYQRKRSTGSIAVSVGASKQPVYGAGPNLLTSFSSGNGLPLQLHIEVDSQAYVIWRIVRPRYRSNIDCDLVLNPNPDKLGNIRILSQDCHSG